MKSSLRWVFQSVFPPRAGEVHWTLRYNLLSAFFFVSSKSVFWRKHLAASWRFMMNWQFDWCESLFFFSLISSQLFHLNVAMHNEEEFRDIALRVYSTWLYRSWPNTVPITNANRRNFELLWISWRFRELPFKVDFNLKSSSDFPRTAWAPASK